MDPAASIPHPAESGGVDDKIPEQVVALASVVPQHGPLPPRPIAWRQSDIGWTIVFEDGRKLFFKKIEPPTPAQISPKKGKGK